VLHCVCFNAGIALRVPTPNVSVVDLVIQVEKKTLAEEVNEAFRQVSVTPPPGSDSLRCSSVPVFSGALTNVRAMHYPETLL
jgi:glyceraldehyde-3-phosphate dehydrogenase/erythrose-4-phosphate dehydrogenase